MAADLVRAMWSDVVWSCRRIEVAKNLAFFLPSMEFFVSAFYMISLKFINENHRQTCCVQCGEYYRYLPIYWSGQCRNIDKSEFRTRSTKESIQIRHFKVPSAILNEIGGEEDKCVRGFFFPTFFSFIQFFFQFTLHWKCQKKTFPGR